MAFLNPSYLWALLGLAIPIAIHLWSKKEGKTIKIGSIKLLSAEDSRQSSSININELLLLFLRMSLITLVVLLMAEPQIKRENSNTPITYIIEPSLITNQEIATVIDSLSSGTTIRLLQNGFPELSEDALGKTAYPVPNYWQLAKQMEALATDSIIVFTNAFSAGLKGKRPTLSKNTAWIIMDPEKASDQILETTLKNDKIEVLSVLNNSQNLSFKKANIPLKATDIEINETQDSITLPFNDTRVQQALKTASPINVLLYADDKFTNESRYIEAGLKAIATHLNRPIAVTKTQDASDLDRATYGHIVWLSDSAIAEESARILIYKPDEMAQHIIAESESINEYHLTQRLNAENIIDGHLTEHLVSWLNMYQHLEERITDLDKRVIAKAELLPVYEGGTNDSTYIETLSISKWLWILLAVVLIAERIIAKLRKQ